jgi:hypothetical protein
MQKHWSHCAFYRAQNTSARIIALLRNSHGPAGALAQPEYQEELTRLLRGLGPECEQIYEELTTRPALDSHDLDELDARLRAQLEFAEEKLPDALDELEQYLFQPVCQDQILAEELEEIGRLRAARQSGPVSYEAGNVQQRASRSNLCGLALSGGGVRSATFNFGLLQGMTKHGILPDVDYLSMVSGGGYIGGWLVAWIKRDGFDAVQKSLADEESSPRGPKTRPLAFLRDYASYLTPQTGLFSADTWTALMTWSRNTFLNLIILLSGLSSLLLIPRLLKSSQIGLQGWLHKYPSHYPEESLMLIAVLCEVIIIVHAGRNLRQFKNAHEENGANSTPAFGYTPRQIQNWIIVPALLAASLGSARLWGLAVELGSNPDRGGLLIHLLGLGAMVAACFVLLAYLQWRGGFVECFLRERRQSSGQLRKARFLCFFLPFLVAIVKAALLGAVYLLFRHIYDVYPCNDSNGPCTADSIAVTCGAPILLVVFAICLSVHMGLMGRNLPDDRREWWSRIAAYLGIYAAGISTIFAVAFFGKDIFASIAKIPVASGWILTTAGGLFFAQRNGREKNTSENERKSALALRAFIALSPVVFVAGLFIILSTGLDRLLTATESFLLHTGSFLSHRVLMRPSGLLENSTVSNPLVVSFYLVFFLIVMFGFASTVDINEFSMHHFYRNRLIRAYLGASHCTNRRPNRLTGFDETDDLPMASLRPQCEPGLRDYGRPYTGPYPVFNAALNLVHGDRLSWQERKATSFVFTPKFCGYDYQPAADVPATPPLRNAGFRPTSVYAYRDGGIHLGTAMAISGAALSPNSGSYTSTSLAFLLTVFNVRLGWWMGNPRNDTSWQRSGPRFGLVYLLYELFGWTNDRQQQVYLSDGGHFDNLGIYELVRRRCSLIIASDAEEDGDCSFHGLGAVIRKCFIDFGVRIVVNLDDIRPKHNTFSEEHFAIGRIHYPEGWSGTLLYIKSSLTGDEPADLREYMARRQTFPNQSTADQFFDESQFESYHRLGLHIAKCAFGPSAIDEMPPPVKKIRERCWAEPDEDRATVFWTENTHAASGD